MGVGVIVIATPVGDGMGVGVIVIATPVGVGRLVPVGSVGFMTLTCDVTIFPKVVVGACGIPIVVLQPNWPLE